MKRTVNGKSCKKTKIGSRRPEGSITVFFAGVFTVVIAFLLALLSFGRMLVMQNGVRRDIDLAAFSVMAEYQKEWAEDYGLYMIPESRLKGGLIYYLEENASHPTGGVTYSAVQAEAESSLMDPECAEEQITQFMKERGILALLDEVISDLEDAKTLEKTCPEGEFAGTVELVGIQEIYASLVTLLDGLKNDGTYKEYYVNGLFEAVSPDEVKGILEKAVAAAEAEDASRMSSTDGGDNEGSGEESEEPKEPEPVSGSEKRTLRDASDWLEEVEELSGEGKALMEELIEELEGLQADPEKAKAAQLLPFTIEDIRTKKEKLDKNEEACKESREALEDALVLLEGKPDIAELQDVTGQFDAIDDFEEVHLPYEYKKPTKELNLSDLLHQLQGFPENLSDYVIDEEKSFFTEGIPEGVPDEEKDEMPSLSDISLGERFERTFLVSEYCVGIFRNFRETIVEKDDNKKPENLRGKDKKDRFFDNEAEYLICGKHNEYENVNGTRRRLVALREALNLAYLLTDSGKRQEIEAMAGAVGGILIPGVGDAVMFAAISLAWSTAESLVDYRLLTEGRQIPLIKDDRSWSTSLENVTELNLEEAAPEENELGWEYAEYLRILFYLMDPEVRVERIQTLLFLNHSEFPLTEAITSFTVAGQAEGIAALNFESRYGYYEENK